jgi:hypothetical protein
VTITCNDEKQTGEVSPIRGYMSSVQPVVHFGLGNSEIVNNVFIEWPDGRTLNMAQVRANQTVVARHREARKDKQVSPELERIFVELKNIESVKYTESQYDDYAKEILLPYKLSTLGPVIAKADVNGDELDDFYLGGSTGNPGTLYLQSDNGMFVKFPNISFEHDAVYEDGCATFYDIDSDKDMDLYICSGSNEFDTASSYYQDRLYLNDGMGNFQKSDILPKINASTSVAVPMDFDGDGDMDVFVGARQIPGQYGRLPRSLLLRNVNGKYEDIGSSALPDEGFLGMVTDACWEQMMENQMHLVIAGEWMAIRMFVWGQDRFVENHVAGLEGSEGFWNRIIPVDIDVDGDLDLVAGNCGKNLKYSADAEKPFKMLVNDFDGNGSNDVYLGYYDKEDGKCYPVRGRECSSQQMPFVKTKFASYSDFANATIDKVLEGRLEGSLELHAKTFASGIFENVDGEFQFHPFKNEAQIAPVYGIVVSDFNNDSKPDLFLAGNYYNREVETTRSDAGIGSLLLSSEGLSFEYVHPSKTGILAHGDVRNVILLHGKSDSVLAIINNNSEMQFYRSQKNPQIQ